MLKLLLYLHLIHIRHRIRLDLHPPSDKPLHVKGVLRVCIGQIFVMRMLCNVILARQKRAHTAKLQDALAAVQHFKLIHGQQAFTELLVIQAVRRFASPRFACVVGVDGLSPKRFGQGFERRRLFAAEKQARVTVADDGFRIVLVQCLELALRLQNQTRGDFSAANRRHQLFEFRNLPDIGALVDQATHMHGQSPAVHIVRLVAQEVEKLGMPSESSR